MDRCRAFLEVCRVIYGIAWLLAEAIYYSEYVRSKLRYILYPFMHPVALSISIITSLLSLPQKWSEFRAWLRNIPNKLFMLRRLKWAKTYDDWERYALTLDRLYGADEWYVTTKLGAPFQVRGTSNAAYVLDIGAMNRRVPCITIIISQRGSRSYSGHRRTTTL